MTVTFTVSPSFDIRNGYSNTLLRVDSHDPNHEGHSNCPAPILSVTEGLIDDPNSVPMLNSFVRAFIQASDEQLILAIRPDDVWIAILTQLNSYLKSHPEEHRGGFMAHDGPVELQIVHDGPFDTCDWKNFNRQIFDEFQPCLAPVIRQWIRPRFSTTSAVDTLVCSAIAMSTMQRYAGTIPKITRGNPAVRVLGITPDWENILDRIERVSGFSKETEAWYKLLAPVISCCIDACEDPYSPKIQEFWKKAASETHNEFGDPCLSGWITVFCYWDEYGHKLHGRSGHQSVNLNGVQFDQVAVEEIPCTLATTPVQVNADGNESMMYMMAGSICTGSNNTASLQSGPGMILSKV